jgi:hypothetical protein
MFNKSVPMDRSATFLPQLFSIFLVIFSLSTNQRENSEIVGLIVICRQIWLVDLPQEDKSNRLSSQVHQSDLSAITITQLLDPLGSPISV